MDYSKKMKQHRITKSKLSSILWEYGLTPSQWLILSFIKAESNDQITASKISKEIGVSPAFVTTILTGLEYDGYITRRDHRDKRVKIIEMSSKRINVIKEISEKVKNI